jgi:hypothetical protein
MKPLKNIFLAFTFLLLAVGTQATSFADNDKTGVSIEMSQDYEVVQEINFDILTVDFENPYTYMQEGWEVDDYSIFAVTWSAETGEADFNYITKGINFENRYRPPNENSFRQTFYSNYNEVIKGNRHIQHTSCDLEFFSVLMV